MSTNPKIIVIVGPTASGKTTLGIALSKKFDGEVISADSRQIYRGMSTGTGKPTVVEMGDIPHHLLDIRNPDEEYSVAEYKTDAITVINDVLSRGKLPILVGGTGLYVKAVVDNLDMPDVKADPVLRAQIESDIERDGLAVLFKKLLQLDPDAEGIVDPKNPRRVVRALEVAIATGKPFTAQRKKEPQLFSAFMIGLNPPGGELRKRIDARIDRMMQSGLENEVRGLIKKYGAGAPALNAIGYREMIGYINGTSSLIEAVAAIKLNTWHYAKRQTTWFKKDKAVHWAENEQEAMVFYLSALYSA